VAPKLQEVLLANMRTEVHYQPSKEVKLRMKKHFQKAMRRFQGRSGQSLVEYALILALISVVAILVLRGIGGNVNTKLGSVNSNLG
jgi:Flp pilus assembly pilin Flp